MILVHGSCSATMGGLTQTHYAPCLLAKPIGIGASNTKCNFDLGSQVLMMPKELPAAEPEQASMSRRGRPTIAQVARRITGMSNSRANDYQQGPRRGSTFNTRMFDENRRALALAGQAKASGGAREKAFRISLKLESRKSLKTRKVPVQRPENIPSLESGHSNGGAAAKSRHTVVKLQLEEKGLDSSSMRGSVSSQQDTEPPTPPSSSSSSEGGVAAPKGRGTIVLSSL